MRKITPNIKIFFFLLLLATLFVFHQFKFDLRGRSVTTWDETGKVETCGDTDGEYCRRFGSDDFALRLEAFDLSTTYCEDLTSQWPSFNMSRQYYKLLPLFEASYKEAISDAKDAEGHSNQVPEEMMMLHYLAGTESVKTVCETGFNYGHSSFNFLTANPNLKVNSFDLGSHGYAMKMAKALPEVLKEGGKDRGRLTVRFGDSTVEIPKAIANGSLPLCDLIFVDGGHVYPVARADLLNLARHSTAQSLILFDDYPTNWGASFGKAWDELLISEKTANEILRNLSSSSLNRNVKDELKDRQKKQVHIVQVLRCGKREHLSGFQRGFVAGRIILH